MVTLAARQYLTETDIEKMAAEEGVSPREFLDRLIQEQRRYFEQRFTEHEAHHDRDRDAGNRAIQEARERVEQRLEALNELRTEVVSDRTQFVKSEVFDARLHQAETDRARLQEDLGKIREELARQKGRSAAYAAVLAVALVIVPVALSWLLRGPFNP